MSGPKPNFSYFFRHGGTSHGGTSGDFLKIHVFFIFELFITSKIPVRWPDQCYGFTLSLIFKYCGGI